MKRFWKEVAVVEGDRFGITLDGRRLKTPAKADLAVPTRALADAIADEWRDSGEEVDPRAMPLTGRTHQLRAHLAAIGFPIVGDAKYGGAEAFLTGGISRKLHLHARRLRIDGPDGKPIDHQAELPAHFAESLATLGFDRMAGDNLPLDAPDPAKLPEVKARRAAAAAKSARKARKGERRSRGQVAAQRKGGKR
jgi:hypothetical protein